MTLSRLIALCLFSTQLANHGLPIPLSSLKVSQRVKDSKTSCFFEFTSKGLNSKLLNNLHIIEGSLEVKLPTIWTDEKQSRAEAEGRERLEERRVEEKESEERRCRCAKR